MKKAFKAWIWSLKVVACSYRTVVALALLIAVWAFAAYAWLGLPESSGLLLILAFLWAVVQLLVAAVILEGLVFTAAETSAAGGHVPLKSLWSVGGKRLLAALAFCLAALLIVFICGAVFDWINGHSVEVASFLTFHSQKPVSHVLLEQIYGAIEDLLWIIIAGFLLSLFIVLLRQGWGAAARQSGRLLAACAFRAPFLTSLLGIVVFGGCAYKLALWHPLVTPGFTDYTQVIVRFTVVLLLISAGAIFWPLALARLILPNQTKTETLNA